MASKYDDALNILAVFHFVIGGLMLFFASVPMVMVLVFNFANWFGGMHGPRMHDAVPATIFMTFMGFVVLSVVVLGICVISAGRCLMKKRGYVFCMVVAAILCIFFPLGTLLGVFTIIVLMQDEVRRMFEGGRSGVVESEGK
ncbi:hypothetical protein STSP2_01289 [Anaerohalosphaera lusitana]|uniref:DUF4064 domain-containing protein n=1 Tax=Anaerohalosphaera lusitana TaxID=1936003 RepID=A0A1U9NK68_9BACT|nr:hypothetical protein [Anaerohalosphaera lusitana]AQT68134.1 hypothetical protein STSP2_01289 [Anaerohalosphaera lusitana]